VAVSGRLRVALLLGAKESLRHETGIGQSANPQEQTANLTVEVGMNQFKDRTGQFDLRLIAVIVVLAWVVASAYLTAFGHGAFIPVLI
jgi:hypothetical protein